MGACFTNPSQVGQNISNSTIFNSSSGRQKISPITVPAPGRSIRRRLDGKQGFYYCKNKLIFIRDTTKNEGASDNITRIFMIDTQNSAINKADELIPDDIGIIHSMGSEYCSCLDYTIGKLYLLGLYKFAAFNIDQEEWEINMDPYSIFMVENTDYTSFI